MNETPGPKGARSPLLSARDAAEYLGLSVQTLAKARCLASDGPPYIKLGRRVLYAREDLDRYVAERRFAFVRGPLDPDTHRRTGTSTKTAGRMSP